MQRQAVDPERFKEVLGAVAASVAVVTSAYHGRAHGSTVSAFCSLSLDPPLVLVALDCRSDLLALVARSKRFAVNVLADTQRDLAIRFARKGPQKFAGVDWTFAEGAPRLAGGRGFIACELLRRIPAGDHEIVIGLVDHAERSDRAPLLYCERSFGRLAVAS